MKPECWCESDKPVGTVWVVVDEFGRTDCRKAIAERTRFISRKEREDCDDFGAPTGNFREIGVVTVTEEAASDPNNESILAKAASLRQQIAIELSLTPVVYETNAAWWIDPNRDSPTFGNHYAIYKGLGTWCWYRRVGDRIHILKRGEWEWAVKQARKNDYLRQDEANTSPEVFAMRRELCERYAELPYVTRETLLAVIAAM